MPGMKVKGPRSNTHKEKSPVEKRGLKSVTKELDALRLELQTALKGYHQQAYSLMAKALSVALLLRADKKLMQKFIRHVKPKSDGKGDSTSLNIVTEVMAYVMGATSDSNRKLAWKRGRVIEFLHDQGIKIAKIAAEIRSRGGIEAVLKQATKQQPRRDKGFTGKKTSAKKSAAIIATSRHQPDRDASDSDESDIGARSPVTERRNDGQVTMGVLINLSDRDRLFELLDESKASLVVKRVDGDGAKVAVVRVKKLKPGVRKLEDDDGW